MQTAHNVAPSVSIAMDKFPGAAQPELHAPSLLLPSFTETGPKERDQRMKELVCETEVLIVSRDEKIQLRNGADHRFSTAEQRRAASLPKNLRFHVHLNGEGSSH